MARVDYDVMAGLRRLAEAAGQLDERAAIILTYHAALEREIDIVLSRLLPRPHKLRGLGFGQKLAVIDAAWRGPPKAGDLLIRALFRFNELRNAVAHGDRAHEVDAKLRLLSEAYAAVIPDNEANGDIAGMAAGLIGFMGDNPNPHAALQIRHARPQG